MSERWVKMSGSASIKKEDEYQDLRTIVTVLVKHDLDRVFLDLTVPCAAVALTPASARRIATSLLLHAEEVELLQSGE